MATDPAAPRGHPVEGTHLRKNEIGFVPAIAEQAVPKANNAWAVVCGPPPFP